MSATTSQEDGLIGHQGNNASEAGTLNTTIPSDAEVSITELNHHVNEDAADTDTDVSNDKLSEYGFSLPELYKFSLEFYKKGKKVLNFTYQDKLKLTAFWKQISVGKYDEGKMPETGYLDVIGNDRRRAWQALGDMSPTDAMKNFCRLLQENCNEFTPYMEAQKRDKEEKERIQKEAIEKARREEEERIRKEEEERRRREEEAERKRAEEAERKRLEEEARVLAAAETQKKLEEEKRQKEEEERRKALEAEVMNSTETQNNAVPGTTSSATSSHALLYNSSINGITGRVIAPASLWTRPKVNDFIQHVKRDASAAIVVGRGETITIRVPTHENGSCLFWEFATEYYDVGFGVYFEWSIPPSHDVSVNVDESDQESDDDITKEDNEDKGSSREKPLVDEVLPVLRRNSHTEVIVGSHIYPGQGVYLLKFDNSYSLLRSKTLYYRVYYTR